MLYEVPPMQSFNPPNNRDRQPVSSAELVGTMGGIVREQYQLTGRPLDGAFLAYLIRAEFPAIDYPKLGMSRLSDAVRVAEAEQIVRRNPLVKHLEVTPVLPEPSLLSREPQVGKRVE